MLTQLEYFNTSLFTSIIIYCFIANYGPAEGEYCLFADYFCWYKKPKYFLATLVTKLPALFPSQTKIESNKLTLGKNKKQKESIKFNSRLAPLRAAEQDFSVSNKSSSDFCFVLIHTYIQRAWLKYLYHGIQFLSVRDPPLPLLNYPGFNELRLSMSFVCKHLSRVFSRLS